VITYPSDVDWAALASSGLDGARLYLLPTAPVPPAFSAVRLGGAALGYAALRLIVYADGKRLLDQLVQFDMLESALSKAPAHLAEDGRQYLHQLAASRAALQVQGDKTLAFTKPRIMGVLNVTPDSFSDGGQFIDTEVAIARGLQMQAEGADIIDIGGESTRPGAKPVWEGEEQDRILPVIEGLARENMLISVDTRHATTMKAAIEAGAHIINDVSALSYDPGSLETAAQSEAPVMLMHAQGTPATMQEAPVYGDVLLDVFTYLEGRIEACESAGISRANIVVDPGLGFGKRVVADNLALLSGLSLFHTLGVPILVGASRKRFIGAITGVESAEQRLAGSLAVAVDAVRRGAQLLRVHDVAATREALAMAQALTDGEALNIPTGLY